MDVIRNIPDQKLRDPSQVISPGSVSGPSGSSPATEPGTLPGAPPEPAPAQAPAQVNGSHPPLTLAAQPAPPAPASAPPPRVSVPPTPAPPPPRPAATAPPSQAPPSPPSQAPPSPATPFATGGPTAPGSPVDHDEPGAQWPRGSNRGWRSLITRETWAGVHRPAQGRVLRALPPRWPR